jgi:ribulose bisphosphate carboxylase small subunit
MKGKKEGKFNSEIQRMVKDSAIVLEQVRKQYAENGIPMITFDCKICETNEVILVFPDGSRKIKNCRTNELRILP